MFEISFNTLDNLVVTNTKSTNGFKSGVFSIETTVDVIVQSCVGTWSLGESERLELIGALVRHFRANMSFGDVARSMGYPALVD